MPHPTPQLIGRTDELSLLTNAVDDLAAGRGRVVLVSGAAGIGKSRLVDEALTRSAQPAARGHCDPAEGVPALWPWWQVLADRPDLVAMLDAAPPDGLTPTSADGTRLRVFDQVLRALSGLVVLEDLHWADRSSLTMLRLAAGRPGLVVLATFRDDEGPAALRDTVGQLRRHPGTELLALRPWTDLQVERYLAGTADPSWAPVLHRTSGGNPLLVGELVSALARSGIAQAPAPDAWPLGVPEQLRAIVSGRLAGLAGTTRDVVSACAVVGVGAGAADVEALTGLSVAQLSRACADAGGLLRAGTFEFEHVLVRDAVYGELDVDVRLDWHRRLADAIEAGELRGEPVTHRLRSITDGPSRAAAVLACRSAATTATTRLAFDRAAELLDSALAVVGADSEVRAELLLDAADAEYRAGLSEAALRRCRAAADLTDRPDLLVRAALTVRGMSAAAEQLVPLCDRALAVLPASDEAGKARVLAQRALALADAVRTDAADEPSRIALELAERSGVPLALADALRARQQVLSGPVHVVQRLDLAARMIGLGENGPPDGELWARLWRIDAGLQLGSMSTVDDELARLGLLADRLGWPLAHWHLHRMRAARALLVGRFADAADEADQAVRAAALLDDIVPGALDTPFRMELLRLTGGLESLRPLVDNLPPRARIPIAWAQAGRYYSRLGDLDAAAACFDRVRPEFADLDREGKWLPTCVLFGLLAADLGERDAVEQCYDELLPLAGYYQAAGSGTIVCKGSLSRVLGVLAGALGRRAEAVRHLTDGIAMDDRIGALPYRVLGELALAELLADGTPAERDRASTLARQAGVVARRLGMAPALTRVDRLLTGARAAVNLTRREREVLALLALGAANRAIAEELVLSERTVESHVSNLFGKLGVANRAQAAAWAATHLD